MIKEKQHTHLNEEFFTNSCFRSIADNSINYIMIIDPDNYIIKYINKLFPSVKLEDVLGKTVFDFIAPEYLDLYRQKLLEIKETHQSAFIESVGKSTYYADKKAWYQTQISIIKSRDGIVEGIMVIAEDINDHKINEQELNNKSEKIKVIRF